MNRMIKAAALAAVVGLVSKASADVTVGVDPTQNWIAYMNVSELPANGGGYVFGSGWGVGDTDATFSTSALTITPNTSIDRDVPNDTFWWQDSSGTSPGNKIMDASVYVEDSSTLPGQTVDFTGNVLSNTLVAGYTSVAFIKDFAPDYSSSTSVTVPLTPGTFNLSLPTTAGTHVQYGFETVGADARLATIASLGNVQIAVQVVNVKSTWTSTTSGDWNTAGNWSSTIPNAVDAEADLFSALATTGTVYTDSSSPIVLGTLNFNNANTYVVTGAGSMTLQTSSGSAAVIVQQGTQKLNLPVTFASNTNLNVSAGSTLLISNPVTVDAGVSVTKIGAGTVSYQSTVTLQSGASLALVGSTTVNALALEANASATLGSIGSTRSLLQTSDLSLAGSSILNLNNNDLIVHGGGVWTIENALQSGYAGGTWSGNGIQSSAAAADSTHLTALGSMIVSAAGTFDGATVAAGDVVVRYTYYGDATLDGSVNSADYSRIDAGYLGHMTGWQNGDFNYDGVVNGSDYTLIDNAFNTQGSPIGSASAQFATATAQIAGATTAVPEPATISLLTLGAVGLLTRRRRD